MSANPFLRPAPPAGDNPFLRKTEDATTKLIKRSWGETAKDTAVGVGQGTASLGGALATVPDLLTGGAVSDYAVKPLQRLASRALGGPDQDQGGLSAGLTAVNQVADEAKSPILRAKQRELADTPGFFASAGKVLSEPVLLGQFAAEQVPILGTLGLGAAGTAMKAATGLTGNAARQVGTKAAERALTVAQPVMSAGFAGQQAQEQALAEDDATWQANPEYQALLAGGIDPQAAKEQVARKAGLAAAPIAAGTSFIASKLTAPLEAQIFTRALQRNPGFMGAATQLGSGIAREAGQEAIEEGGEQFAGNVGVQQFVSPSQDPFEGVAQAAGTAAAVGGALGGVTVGAGMLDPAARTPITRVKDPKQETPPPEVMANQSAQPPANPLATPPAGPMTAAAQTAQATGAAPAAPAAPVVTPAPIARAPEAAQQEPAAAAPVVDPVLDRAKQLLAAAGKVNRGALAEQLGLNRNQTQELLDKLQADGIISGPNGKKPRTLLTNPLTGEVIDAGEKAKLDRKAERDAQQKALEETVRGGPPAAAVAAAEAAQGQQPAPAGLKTPPDPAAFEAKMRERQAEAIRRARPDPATGATSAAAAAAVDSGAAAAAEQQRVAVEQERAVGAQKQAESEQQRAMRQAYAEQERAAREAQRAQREQERDANQRAKAERDAARVAPAADADIQAVVAAEMESGKPIDGMRMQALAQKLNVTPSLIDQMRVALAQRKAASKTLADPPAAVESNPSEISKSSFSEAQPAPAEQYDDSPDVTEDDITPPSGGAFSIRSAAEATAKRTPGGKVFEVDGGFVVRVPKAVVNESLTTAATGKESLQVAPAPAILPTAAERLAAKEAERDAKPVLGNINVATLTKAEEAVWEQVRTTPERTTITLGELKRRAAAPATVKESLTVAPDLAGEPIDKKWTAFKPESGTLNVPRADMPQVKSEHRGAMVQYLAARGIKHAQDEVPADSLKPTQAEFSPAKVAKAKAKAIAAGADDRSILVSSDGHVLDGHHQWLAKRDAGEPVKVIRLDAPIAELLQQVKEFPSSTQAKGATAAAPANTARSVVESELAAGDKSNPQLVAAMRGRDATKFVDLGLVELPDKLIDRGARIEQLADEIASEPRGAFRSTVYNLGDGRNQYSYVVSDGTGKPTNVGKHDRNDERWTPAQVADRLFESEVYDARQKLRREAYDAQTAEAAKGFKEGQKVGPFDIYVNSKLRKFRSGVIESIQGDALQILATMVGVKADSHRLTISILNLKEGIERAAGRKPAETTQEPTNGKQEAARTEQAAKAGQAAEAGKPEALLTGSPAAATKENGNEPNQSNAPGTAALAPAAAGDVRPAAGGGKADASTARGKRGNGKRDGGAAPAGDDRGTGVGVGAREAPVPAAGAGAPAAAAAATAEAGAVARPSEKPAKPSGAMERQRMPRGDAVAEVQRQLKVTKKRATEIVSEIKSEAKNLNGVTYNLKPGIVQTADVQAAIERERAAKQAPAALAVATHKEPGQPAEPVTAPVIAEAIKTSAAKTPLNLKEARAWLLARVDEALKGALQQVEAWAKADVRPEYDRETKGIKLSKEEAEAVGFVTFDVPGDGKFKVLNTREGLQAFRAKVAASSGFKDERKASTRPAMPKSEAWTVINDFLEDDEYGNIYTYANAVGKPLRFGEGGNGTVTAYAVADDVQIAEGINAFVGRAAYKAKVKVEADKNKFISMRGQWMVIEVSTGKSMGGFWPNRDAAIAASKRNVEKMGIATVRKNIAENAGRTEKQREQDWLKAAAPDVYALVNGEVEQEAAPAPGAAKPQQQVAQPSAAKPQEESARQRTVDKKAITAETVISAVRAAGYNHTGIGFSDVAKHAAQISNNLKKAGVPGWVVDMAMDAAKKASAIPGRANKVSDGPIIESLRKSGFIKTEAAQTTNPTLAEVAKNEPPSEWQLQGFIKIAADSVESLRTVDVERVLRETPAQHRQAVAEYIKKKTSGRLDAEVDDVMSELGAAPAVQPEATTGPADAKGERKFYVTMIRDSKVARIAGPFDTKEEADAILPAARDRAKEVDPRAVFDAFGVSAVTMEEHKPAALNEQLGIGKKAPRNYRSIDTVSAFNPVENEDWFKLNDGDWQAKNGYSGRGWSLVQDGKLHPRVRNIEAQTDLIRALVAENDRVHATGVPESYKPAGEPFYNGPDLIQGYAKFAMGERVKLASGIQGVVTGHIGKGPILTRAMVKFDNGTESGVDERELSAVAPAEQDDDAPTMTRPEARELMFWQDMGQNDGEKSHRLTFYPTKDDAEAKRGGMTYGRVTKDASSSKWFVEDGDSFTSLADAKRQAMEMALDKAEREGYIAKQPESRFNVPNPPTFDYRLKQRGGRTILIPPVGQSFTKEMRTALRDWARAAGFFSSITGDNEVGVAQITGGPSLDYIVDGVQEQRIGREVAKDAAAKQEAQAKAPAKPDAITDFGEKLPPARRAMAAKLDEALTDDDIANRPLSEIWPLAENEAIEDTFAAAVAHAARDEVPAKPRTPYKVRQWVEKVKGVRELAARIVSGRTTRDEFVRRAQAPDSRLKDWIAKVLLLEQLPRDQWKRIGVVEERPDARVYRDGNWVPSPHLRMAIDGKSAYFEGDATVAGNIEAIREKLRSEATDKRMQFEIRGASKGPFKVNKKGDPEYRALMEFATVEEARAAVQEYDGLVAAWEAVKARDNITERDLRKADNRPRVGKDHRGGRDVKPEDFQQQFGFRGGEFGKWVEQGKGDKDRQTFLNNAYDALMDLAELVGIPPRAVSLNGTLGIAFGSRGSGWASAHFEPSNLVINLTKTRGAGALAHEWFHALDNYFSRIRRDGAEAKFTGDNNKYTNENYITHHPEPMYVFTGRGMHPPLLLADLQRYRKTRPGASIYNEANWAPDPAHPQGVRPVVERRFAELVEALNNSPMTKRAQSLDKNGRGYWSSTLERAARAFENHVIARMHEQGYQNDFLANVQSIDDFVRNPARYPYLLPGEVKPIADAFDALFNTVQTRTEPSGNVAMFAKSGEPDPAPLDVRDLTPEQWQTLRSLGLLTNEQADLLEDGSEDAKARKAARRVLRDISPTMTKEAIDAKLASLAKVKERLQDLKPAVSVPDIDGELTPELQSRIISLGYLLQGFAEVKDEAFDYGTAPKGEKDIQKIAAAMLEARGLDTPTFTKGETKNGVEHWKIEFRGREGTFEVEPGGLLQLHIGDLMKNSGAGSQLYAVFNAWAARNGYKALPDRRGLSEVNKYRRTANMLSSAMREGSTAHLMPHPDQSLPHWKRGRGEAAAAFNIGYMALREAKRVLNPRKHAHRIHLLDKVRYDFDQNVFVDSKGRAISVGEYDSVLSQAAAGQGAVGRRSAQRAHFAASSWDAIERRGLSSRSDVMSWGRLAADAGAKSGLRALGRTAGDAEADPALELTTDPLTMRRAYYLRDNETPANAGVSASGAARRGLPVAQLERILGAAAKAMEAAHPGLKVIFVANHAELQAHPDPEAQRIVSQDDYDSTVQAALSPDRTRVFFIADRIRSPKQAHTLFAHEAVGHYSMEQMLGPRLFAELRDRIIALKDAGKWPEVFAEVSKRYERNADGTFRPLDDNTFASEAIAVFAEKNIQTSILQRAMNAVRGFLRKFFPQLELSQGELRQMLWEAGQYLEGKAYRPDVAARALGERPAPRTQREAVERYAFGKGGRLRTTGIPTSIERPVSLWRNDQPLKAHPGYKAAKAGDQQAAVDLIGDVAAPLAEQAAKFGSDAIYVAPHAIEASGKNAIPRTLAAYLAAQHGARFDTEVVQTNRAYHTGAKAMERLMARSVFDGAIEEGAKYVLVDDVTTMGGTLADLASYIQANGGVVVGSVTLVNAARSGKLAATAAVQRKLEARLGDEIRKQFDIEPGALTAEEASYVAGFRDVVELRNRAATATRERAERLRARGILEEESSVAEAQQDQDQAPPSEGLGASGGRGSFAKGSEPTIVDRIEELWNPRDTTLVQRLKDKAADWRPTALGALQLRHLGELGEDMLPPVAEYADTVQHMQTLRNELQQASIDIVESAMKYQGANKPEALRMYRMLMDATLAGVDPSAAHKRLLMLDSTEQNNQEVTPAAVKAFTKKMDELAKLSPGSAQYFIGRKKEAKKLLAQEKKREASHAAMAPEWAKLSPEGKKMWAEISEAYVKQSDKYQEALMESLKAAITDDRQKSRLIAQLKLNFESNRVPFYVPLSRWGEYFVAATAPDGTREFHMQESTEQQRLVKKRLQAAGYTKISSGVKSKITKQLDGASASFIAEVDKVLQEGHAPEKIRNDVYQLYLTTLPEMSMRKNFIHRKGTPGFSEDVVRALASHVFHSSYQIARLKFTHKLDAQVLKAQALADAMAEVDAPDANKAGQLVGELRDRHEWVMNPQDSAGAQKATTLGFLWYLAVSPAAAAVNLLQTVMVSFPVLGARYGFGTAAASLARSMKQSMKTFGNMDKGTGTNALTPDEQRAYDEFKRRGTFDKSQVHNLAGLSETDTHTYNPALHKALSWASFLFHRAEVVNREATSMATYRMAREAGKSHDMAIELGDKAVNQTHFDYSASNRSRYMRGPVAKVLLQFKQYSMGMTWLLGRMAWKSLKDVDPATRKENMRALTGMLGMTAVFSGAMGLPMMGLTMSILNAVAAAFGDDDEPWDAEAEFRAFLREMLGEKGAEYVMRGPVQGITGLGIASRVGLGELWMRAPDREMEGQALAHYYLEQFAGPVVGGMFVSALRGKQLMEEGHVWRGVEAMLPKAVKDVMKAIRFADEGVNTLRGDPVVEDLGVLPTIAQLMGMAPASVSNAYDVRGDVSKYADYIKARKSRLLDAYAMAWRLGDADAQQDTLAKMRAFSAKYPELAITGDTIKRSLTSRARYSAQAENGVVVDPRIRARLESQLGMGQ